MIFDHDVWHIADGTTGEVLYGPLEGDAVIIVAQLLGDLGRDVKVRRGHPNALDQQQVSSDRGRW